MEIIKDQFGNDKEVIATYKGFKITLNLIGYLSNSVSIINHDNEVLNKTIPFHSVSVDWRNQGFKKYRPQAACYSSREDTATSIEYCKKEIDKAIESENNRQLKRIETHSNSKITTFVLNNVTINVVQYGDDLSIYVNEMPLRSPFLPEDFTLNDVLLQIHTRTIARHNVTPFSELKTNFYKIRKTFKEDINILPLYEFLGECVKINGRVCFPRRIGTTENGLYVTTESEDKIELTVEEVANIELMTIDNPTVKSSLLTLIGLQNKLRYCE